MGVGTAIVGSASATQPQTWSCTQVSDYKDSEPPGSSRQIYGLILLQTAFNMSTQATGNILENLFCIKCTLKNYLQLLQKNFLSQTNTML